MILNGITQTAPFLTVSIASLGAPNSGFRKFLKVVGDDHFALDEAKVAEW